VLGREKTTDLYIEGKKAIDKGALVRSDNACMVTHKPYSLATE
jgi:hypothetical protein